ncbi:hypothetical protein NVP1139A_16 [Vibrio phage 1.139.A._10N.261.48.C6]|nr:hypothetical protein NVP1139A_16 [Vibrio phage 1.139.A._10N.261.48.C6]AUR90251.1 hypothetical protein NVP1139B_16 [Vibrio phage 1.139.B._10N.261.48.C6]AUR95573.1 hypothetical protein NVP1209O_16 [Vibrio phage 1.209.O._10N.222.52.B2]
MARHNILTGNELHEPKGAATAQQGQVYVADGLGSGGFQFVGAPSIVFVETEADFPAPVGGVITLEDNTVYTVVADVTVVNRFQTASNCAIQAPIRYSASLTYTGTDPLFTGSDNHNFRLLELSIIAPNCALFSFNGTIGNANGGFSMSFCSVFADEMGTLTNVNELTIGNTDINLSSNGVTFSGADVQPVLRIDDCSWGQTDGAVINLGSVECRAIRISFAAIIGDVIGIFSPGEASLSLGSTAKVRDTALIVTVPLDGGITNNSNRWIFQECVGVTNSSATGNTYLNTTQSVLINATGTFEEIGGVNWSEGVNTVFLANADGSLVYTGEANTVFEVTGTSTLEKVGGGTEACAMRIAVNSVTIPQSESQTENGQPTSVSCHALVELAPGDIVNLYVANTGSTDDVEVTVANLLLTKAS